MNVHKRHVIIVMGLILLHGVLPLIAAQFPYADDDRPFYGGRGGGGGFYDDAASADSSDSDDARSPHDRWSGSQGRGSDDTSPAPSVAASPGADDGASSYARGGGGSDSAKEDAQPASADDESATTLQEFVEQFTATNPAFVALVNKEKELIDAYNHWYDGTPDSLLNAVRAAKRDDRRRFDAMDSAFYTSVKERLLALPTNTLTLDLPESFGRQQSSYFKHFYGKTILRIYNEMYLKELSDWMNVFMQKVHFGSDYFSPEVSDLLCPEARECVALIIRECCRYETMLIEFAQEDAAIKQALDAPRTRYALIDPFDSNSVLRPDQSVVNNKALYLGKQLFLCTTRMMVPNEVVLGTSSSLNTVYTIVQMLGCRMSEFDSIQGVMELLIDTIWSVRLHDSLNFIKDILSQATALEPDQMNKFLSEQYRIVENRFYGLRGEYFRSVLAHKVFSQHDEIIAAKQRIQRIVSIQVNGFSTEQNNKQRMRLLSEINSNLISVMELIAPLVMPEIMQLDMLVCACYYAIRADLNAYVTIVPIGTMSEDAYEVYEAANNECKKIFTLYQRFNGHAPKKPAAKPARERASEGSHHAVPQSDSEQERLSRLYLGKATRADALAILELPSTATKSDIEKQYRKLARKHHPDKGGDPEKFKEIDAAYKTLIDD